MKLWPFGTGSQFLGHKYASSRYPITTMKNGTVVRKLLSFRPIFIGLAFFPYCAVVLWTLVVAVLPDRPYFLYSKVPVEYKNHLTRVICVALDSFMVCLNAGSFGTFLLFQVSWIFTCSFWLEKLGYWILR